MAFVGDGTIRNIGNSSVHRIHPRHISFINTDYVSSCYILQGKNQTDACKFVQNTTTCSDTVHLLNYLELMVCHGNIRPTLVGYLQICLFMLIIVVLVATFMFLISRFFILPNIVHVAQYMRLPLYHFGSTIIAVIISSPNITWVFGDCTNLSTNSTVLLANMMGNAFMTFNIGLSVVCLGKHSKIPGFEVIKHILISASVQALSYALIFTKLADSFEDHMEDAVFDMRPVAFFLAAIYVSNTVYTILMKRRKNRRSSLQVVMQQAVDTSKFTENGWKQLLHAINPFNHLKMPRVLICLLAPYWVLAAFQIPVIDKQRHNLGWCKYLTCINIIAFPLLVLLFRRDTGDWAVFSFVVGICMILLLITVFGTNTHTPPKFQGFYAVLGILFGFYNYHVLEGELETMMWQTFSYVFNSPRDITMLTGYVFHNMLNLIIFAQELVRLGLGNLACGMVMGLVINQSFLMLPIITFQKCFDNQGLVAISANTTTCFVFMMLSFLIVIINILITNYKLRASQGIYLISYYCVFIIFILLSAFNIIHPYGGYHSILVTHAGERNRWAK